MAQINTADTPLGDLDMSGLPSPNIELPEIDGMIRGGGQDGEGGMPMPPPESMGPPPGAGGPPGAPPQMQMPGGPEMAEGEQLSPAAAIASKMGKQGMDPEGKAINLVSSSIRTLNQLADILIGTDEANAKTVRQIIRVLGEILKNAQHAPANPPMEAGNQPAAEPMA